MVGWHHQLNGQSLSTLRWLAMDREAWRAAVTKSRKESDTTEWLNCSELSKINLKNYKDNEKLEYLVNYKKKKKQLATIKLGKLVAVVVHSVMSDSESVDCSTPSFLVLHHNPGSCSNSCSLSCWCHPTISSCHPLLLLPSTFPSIRSFSHELALHIRWSKYWIFSFSIKPSKKIFRVNFL